MELQEHEQVLALARKILASRCLVECDCGASEEWRPQHGQDCLRVLAEEDAWAEAAEELDLD